MIMLTYLPTEKEKEEIKRVISELVGKLRSLCGSEASIVPVGSTAKDTFLAGDTDIDIYVVSTNYKELYEKAKKTFPNGHRKHGELLIWSFKYNGYDVDLVFTSPIHSKIDTIRHTDFYLKHLSPRDRDEVRKAKAFFKTHGVYGAEIGGITGVAIEELVRRYKTLENICRLFLEKDLSELWLQDPVLKRPRNLLASITKSKYKRIRDACREYLQKRVFHYRKYTAEEFLKKHKDYYFITCRRKSDRAMDYQISKSICESVGREVKNIEKDVNIECEAYVNNEIIIAYKVTPKNLPSLREVCIPKHLTQAIESFKKKHPEAKIYEKGNYICGLIKRKISNPSNEITKRIIQKMQERKYQCKPLSPH